jgi:hypothetical protein
MAVFCHSAADQPNMLHLRAHTFAPIAESARNTLESWDLDPAI